MNPLPDPASLPTPAPDGRELAVTGGLSGMSLMGSFVAMAQNFPAQGGIAVAGIVGSVLIQVVRMTTDNRIAKLTSDLLHAQASARAADEREARHLNRIADLVKQVDAANARADRMLAVALEHAGEMGSDVHKVIAEAAKPVQGGAPDEPAPTEYKAGDFEPIIPTDDTPPAVS